MLILVVDDDPAMGNAIRAGLIGYGYEVVTAGSGTDGLEKLRRLQEEGRQVDILLSDFRMPGLNGLDVIRLSRELVPGLRAVLMTAYGTECVESRLGALEIGYLAKPFSPEDLLKAFAGGTTDFPLEVGNSIS